MGAFLFLMVDGICWDETHTLHSSFHPNAGTNTCFSLFSVEVDHISEWHDPKKP